MKRQRISPQSPIGDGDWSASPASLLTMDASRRTRLSHNDNEPDEAFAGGAAIPMRSTGAAQRPRNVLEAQVQEGDTLQAIAIRYSCSVADIKRLNKIERDYEIHAHKTLQVPLTADNILADHLSAASARPPGDRLPNGPTAAAQQMLLAIDAQTRNVNATGTVAEPSINDIILNTKIVSNVYADNAGDGPIPASYDKDDNEAGEQFLLINEADDDDEMRPQPRPIHGRSLMVHDLSCSGSDCDMSWVCLLVCILALCFAIPLVYVFYIAEHHHDHDEVPALPKLHDVHMASFK